MRRRKSISKKPGRSATSPRESKLDEWQFPIDSFCPPDDEEDENTTMSSELLNATIPTFGGMVHG